MPRTFVVLIVLVGSMLILCACTHDMNPPTATATRVNVVQSSPTAMITEREHVETVVVFVPTQSPVALPTIGQETTELIVMPSPVPPKPRTITIIYDNNSYDNRLQSDWGFSALVEYNEHVLLFDTGRDGAMLMENMRILGIDPTRIESVMLSHAHGDHTGGLTALLEFGARPTVYLLSSFPVAFKRQVERIAQVEEVTPGQSIGGVFYSTGEIRRNTPEQALVIKTEPGLVIITGCAHPGIIEIIEEAREMFAEPVLLVLGGFHLGANSRAEIDAILTDFRRLGVLQVAPCHCTGDQAIARFAVEYGEDYIQAGVGKVIRLDATASK
jgi:7,8-dihydropterin-6-yl-methyl-4-(beta-D-ribofuranosyl)aminobenzene 5'-phosphate synthase